MDFACSHVVCNWRSESLTEDENKVLNSSTPTLPCGLTRAQTVLEHPYDNRVCTVQKPISSLVPPPVPPRNIQQKHMLPSSLPPPIPPRGLENNEETCLKANVNVVSLKVGSLVDISSAIHSNQKPVHCGKCNAIMSSASNPETHQNTTMWSCEFCGEENVYPLAALKGGRFSLRSPPGRDVLYMDDDDDEVDYENLENMLIVFCVDISGSMSVTSEICPGNTMRSPTYISRLQGVQEALQMILTSLQKTAPHRRVALVTFNDEVTVYGDGRGAPLSLRDWALMDYDYLKKEGENYSTPHCIAETIQPLTQKIKELREQGATALGPAALISVAMASQFTGSKVIVCTDGRANKGLGQLEQESSLCLAPSPYFYNQLACYAAEKGVIVSVMTFEGEDCRLAEVGRLADHSGGRINIVNIGTVATEIQSAIADNVLATSVMATLLVPDGMYFPYEEEDHRLVREIGNVTDKVEITFQFAVRPEKVESFQKQDRVPFQLQLSFRTRDLQKVTRVITQQKRVTTSSWVWAGSLNMSVLGVHCAQLCARLTMEGKVKEAQRQLRAQQDLLKDISERKPSPKEESVYGNWISTMSMICEDLTTVNQNKEEHEEPMKTSSTASLSDEAAKVVYQMKRAKSADGKGQKVATLKN
ncbi:Circularly permutated [Triplophysa tibetana]|uniref:Circularly permutated n=1 Tax=Triplophysa tibetana TaxID=1572043 RepID=A0A5A9PMM8_9TELE|nr:Circularly permutated [Triplophysa tibetana]